MINSEYAPVHRGVYSQKPMRHFIIVTVLCGIGISLFVFWLQIDAPGPLQEKPGISALRESATKIRPLVMQSFSYTSFNDYGIDNTLEADELEIKPRRFMAFNIKSINEAVVSNARLTVYTREDTDSEPQYFGFEDIIPLSGDKESRMGRSKAFGLVTRMVLNKMEMDLFRDDIKIITLVSATGLVEKKSGGLNAFNAVLTDARSSRRITTRKLLWDGKRKVFQIPGLYTMSTSSGNVFGESVEVDLDFVITPLDN